MHFEVLVEDQSGKKALDILIPKIISEPHTFRVIAYRGIGHLPKNLTGGVSDRSKRLLLHQLPRLLRGYGRAYQHNGAAVIVVCDLDDRCLKVFRQDLLRVLAACNPRPETRFCIAIEEGEAWLLGDSRSVETAYPSVDRSVLQSYRNDTICGTWELLADAVYHGGSAALKRLGWQAVGKEKSAWAKRIARQMDADRNSSPSFQYFRKQVRTLAHYEEGF